MRKRILLGIFVFGLILFVLVIKTQSTTTLLCSDNYKDDQPNSALSFTSHKQRYLPLISSGPIEIINDANFTNYGFPGLGTAEEPYIIENYNITTSNLKGICINSTTKHFVIRNCYVDAFPCCIYVSNVAEGTASIINNTVISFGGAGIFLSYSSGMIITDNTCSNSRWYGIHLFYSSGATLTNNTCSYNENDGIVLSYSSGATLTNNTCNYNENGIFLDYSSGATLVDNDCINNLCGIFLVSSSDATLTDNTCNNILYGINMLSSSGATLVDNICNNNIEYGIEMLSSSGAILTNNTFSNNHGYGVKLVSSSINTLTKNTCKNNTLGILSRNSNDSLFTYNLLQENSEYGIFFESESYNNIIHHNVFMNNYLGSTSQAYDDGFNNIWCEEEVQEGNYWSDWNKKKPYPIDGDANAIDPYPLNENLEKIDYEYTLVIPAFILVAILLKRKKNTYFRQ